MKEQYKGQRIQIQGYWNNEPIWRFLTAGEVLVQEIEKEVKQKKSVYPLKIEIN